MSRKKEIERAFANLLISSVFNEAPPQPSENEAPDFLLDLLGKKIGLEVTELNVPSVGMQNREVESIEKYIADRAAKSAIQSDVPNLSVFLFFNRQVGLPRSKKKQNIIADALAVTVKNALPNIGERVELDYPYSSSSQPREIDQIHISRQKRSQRHIWRPVMAPWVLQKPSEISQDAINKKNIKYPLYRSKCDECWLILGAEGTKQSSAIRPNNESLTQVYLSKFERVFFLHLADAKCHELKVNPPSPPTP